MHPASRRQIVQMLETFSLAPEVTAFDLGCLDHATGRMSFRKTWTVPEVRRALGWLAARNATGSSCYIRPAEALGRTSWVLTGPLARAGLDRLTAAPGLVVESSPGIFEAWLRLAAPLDARARALGSVGVGLAGAHLLGRDPAAGALAAISTATVTFQSSSAALTDGAETRHTRFPAISASYPYAGNVFAVYLDSCLDQEFEIRSDEMLLLGGRSVGAQHRFTSTGSIGRASLGWSRAVREVFAIGLTVGTYVGVTERRVSLLLDTEHWLAAGTDGEIGVLVSGSRVFRPITLDEGTNVGRYAALEDLVLSGIVWEESRPQLASKAFLIHQPMGRGQLVAFAEDPNYRAYTEATQLLFMNAVLLGPGR